MIGSTPIQAHTGPPRMAHATSAMPTTMRRILSIPPTLVFMFETSVLEVFNILCYRLFATQSSPCARRESGKQHLGLPVHHAEADRQDVLHRSTAVAVLARQHQHLRAL